MARAAALSRPDLMDRRLREAGKRALHKGFMVGQRLGVDVLPRHYYSQIPDIGELRREQAWRRPYDMHAVQGSDLKDQIARARASCPPELSGRLRDLDVHAAACAANGAVGYGRAEADFLFCWIATHRPPRVVQVGCGVSTHVILRAAAEVGHSVEIRCVEPYPTPTLLDLAREGRIELIQRRAQELPPSELADAEAGDLLFIDSTHAVRPGGEVPRLVLEVLPRLAPKVNVHFHDILFPYGHKPGLLNDDLFFWSESLLLKAFLTDNARCRLEVSLSMLHHGAPDVLAELLPGYRPMPMPDGLRAYGATGDFPSATFLQTSM